MGTEMTAVDTLTPTQVEIGDNVRFSDWNGYTREGEVKSLEDNGDTFIVGIDDSEGDIETFEISSDAPMELLMYAEVSV